MASPCGGAYSNNDDCYPSPVTIAWCPCCHSGLEIWCLDSWYQCSHCGMGIRITRDRRSKLQAAYDPAIPLLCDSCCWRHGPAPSRCTSAYVTGNTDKPGNSCSNYQVDVEIDTTSRYWPGYGHRFGQPALAKQEG